MESAAVIWSGQRFVLSGSEIICSCVRAGNEVSAWFPVELGLRQGFVVSLAAQSLHGRNG